MGLLIASEYELKDYGALLSNFVVSVGGTMLGIKKKIQYSVDENDVKTSAIAYEIETQVSFYSSVAAYNNKLYPILTLRHNLTIAADQINADLFALVYASIKQRFNFDGTNI